MFVTECLNFPGTPGKEDWRGNLTYPENCLFHWNYTPNTSSPDWLRDVLCVNVPQAPCVGTHTAYNNRNNIVSARSMHPGGVQILLGDGSARFVTDGISLATWQALGSPAGSEVVGDY
jgi:hypothetical protein